MAHLWQCKNTCKRFWTEMKKVLTDKKFTNLAELVSEIDVGKYSWGNVVAANFTASDES